MSAIVIAEILLNHRAQSRGIADARKIRGQLSQFPSISVIRPVRGADVGAAEKTTKVNQTGYLVWSQVAVRAGLQGSIVNIASIGGLAVEQALGWYNVTKAAEIHLTRHLAAELAPHVRVNAIAPGIIRTDFSRALWEDREELLVKRLPMGRVGMPEDIANTALFLVSDAAAWITGQVLVVDGGGSVGGGF